MHAWVLKNAGYNVIYSFFTKIGWTHTFDTHYIYANPKTLHSITAIELLLSYIHYPNSENKYVFPQQFQLGKTTTVWNKMKYIQLKITNDLKIFGNTR